VQSILNVALPFFAVIAAGYAALRFRFLDEASIAGLNTFVFYVALPALLVGKLEAAPLGQLLDWRLVLDYYGATLALYLVVLGLSRATGAAIGVASLRALCATFTNSGYMGIALLLAAMGGRATLPAILALFLDNIIAMPLTIACLEAATGGTGLAAIGRVLRNLVRNPLMLSVVAGFVLAASGLGLPTPVDGFLAMLGAPASPSALFALRASLVEVPLGSGRVEVGLLVLVKLVLHPLLVAVMALLVLPLPGQLAAAAIITAALPTAATVFVVAQRYETFVMRSSTLVLVTHLGSTITLTALLAYLTR
jgi:predicted permease